MAEVFPFNADWSVPPVERLEWLTDLIPAYDGTEDRTPLRSRPRRSLELATTLAGVDAARLDAFLWRWQAEPVFLPIWTDPQYLGAALSSGATTVPCTTQGYDFADGQHAVLWRSPEVFELCQVATVAPGVLHLATPVASDWPGTTRLYPVRLAELSDVATVPRLTDGLLRAVLRWDIEPSSVTPAPGPNVYQGRELLERRPEWPTERVTEYARRIARVDYQIGPVSRVDQSGRPALLNPLDVTLGGRAAIATWRGWLHARQGRYSPVWAASGNADLVQAGPMLAADVGLPVAAVDAVAKYGLADGRRDVAIYHRSARQWFYRQIVGVASGSGGTEVMTLDAPLGVSAPLGSLAPICWLQLARLEADAVELQWETDALVRCQVQLRGVRE